MFKKEYGISVFPEKDSIENIKKYIIEAKENGFKKMFISFLQFPTKEDFSKIQNLYIEVITFAKENGFYIVADIADSSLEATNSNVKDLSFFENIGISCLRLDSPLMPKDVADITYNTKLDIQLNISNDDSFINNVLDYMPVRENLFGCHNFYPQTNTGLGWEFFEKSTKRYLENGLSTAAFVGSDFGIYGPQKFPIKKTVTIEAHRNKPIRSQIKELIYSNLVSDIYIGNQRATLEELSEIKTIDKKKIELDIKLDTKLTPLESKILFQDNHFSRGDINDNYIRSTMSRVYFKNEINLDPKNVKKEYKRGDVVIINSNDPNYQKELIIILKDGFNNLSENGNLIGKIEDYDLDLIKWIKPWCKFKFRII